MTDRVITAYSPDQVSPPGETLRDVLEEKGISQAELATRMGRPRKTISEIVNGKAAITHETALQLELVTGVPAEFWNSRERAYRAYLASLDEVRRLEKEYSWCRLFPLKEMIRLGWVRKREARAQQVHELFSFLGVVSSGQWDEVYSDYAVAFRRPKAFAPDKYALGAWLRRGTVQSRSVSTAPYDHSRFADALQKARALTVEEPSVFVPALQDVCARAGVVVAFVPELPGSRASGATRWLTPERALIQLSLRYRTNDHLWFTFFHEAAHIVLHGKKLIFIEVNGDAESKEESEANEWAADFLIPRAQYQRLDELQDDELSESVITEFARDLGIAPGIVVGRLQHEKRLLHSQFNSLKVRYEWAVDQSNDDEGAA